MFTKKHIALWALLLILAPLWAQAPEKKLPLVYPPEVELVNSNGSFPLGFREHILKSGVDVTKINFNCQNRYNTNLKAEAVLSAKLLSAQLTPYFKELPLEQREKMERAIYVHMKWWIIRSILVGANNNNFGALVLKDMYWHDEQGKKHPLVVFRAAYTPYPAQNGSFFRTLLDEGNVKHVINLYDGDMYIEDLDDQEALVSEEKGASYSKLAKENYGGWRHHVKKDAKDPEARKKAMRIAARIIREKILLPEGKTPRGNIFIHCGGGMHRTGMIMGILQKCINSEPMERITNIYKYHVSYKNKQNPGGYEQSNVEFIRDFPVELLKFNK